jgi:hypothetical protein
MFRQSSSLRAQCLWQSFSIEVQSLFIFNSVSRRKQHSVSGCQPACAYLPRRATLTLQDNELTRIKTLITSFLLQ